MSNMQWGDDESTIFVNKTDSWADEEIVVVDDSKSDITPVDIEEPVNTVKYKITNIQRRNNIYVETTEDYVSYLEKNVRPCKFGIKCYRSSCNFMHILPEAECQSTYVGKICKNIRQCKKIHQKRCKYDIDCNKKDCSFKHSKDMPSKEAYDEYIKTMKEYNQI